MTHEEILYEAKKLVNYLKDVEEPFKSILFKELIKRQIDNIEFKSDTGVRNEGKKNCDFFKKLDYSNNFELITGLAYHFYHNKGRKHFTKKDIEDLFEQLRKIKPANISDYLSKASKTKNLLLEKNGKYTISTKGDKLVKTKLITS